MHEGRVQAAPAPRFGTAPFPIRSRPDGADTLGVLRDLGVTPAEIAAWEAGGALPGGPRRPHPTPPAAAISSSRLGRPIPPGQNPGQLSCALAAEQAFSHGYAVAVL